jgi:hypothetical protein
MTVMSGQAIAEKVAPGRILRSVVVGCGSALPARCVTNDELSRTVDTSDDWIVQRTGIRQRFLADATETTSVLGARAAPAAPRRPTTPSRPPPPRSRRRSACGAASPSTSRPSAPASSTP